MSGNKNYSRYREELGKRLSLLNTVDSGIREIHTVAPKLKFETTQTPSVSTSLIKGAVGFGATSIVPHLGAHLAELITIQGRV